MAQGMKAYKIYVSYIPLEESSDPIQYASYISYIGTWK